MSTLSSRISRRRVIRSAGVGGTLAFTTNLFSPSRVRARAVQGDSSRLALATTNTDAPGANAIVDLYTAANAGVEVSVDVIAQDYETILRTRLTSGTARDVFQVAPGGGNPVAIVELAQAGFLADLSDQPWAANIPEVFRPVTQVDDKTLLLPLGLGFMSMFYSKAAFDRAGVSVPTTFDEFLKVNDTLKQAGIVPISLSTQGRLGPILIAYVAAASAAYSAAPDLPSEMAAGRATFADSGWRDALEKIVQLLQRGDYNESPAGTADEEQIRLLATGDAAMSPLLSNQYSQVESYGEPGAYGTFPFPANNDPAKNWIAAGLSYGYGAYAESDNLDGAKQFLNFISQPENLARYDEAAGVLPVNGDIPAEVPPALAPMLDLVATGRAATYMDQLWPTAEVQARMVQGIQELFVGEGSVDAVLESMDAAYRE